MEKVKVWVALTALATAKIVGVVSLIVAGLWFAVWALRTLSPDTILIWIGLIAIAFWIWMHTIYLHDQWRRGKIVFPWEKK